MDGVHPTRSTLPVQGIIHAYPNDRQNLLYKDPRKKKKKKPCFSAPFHTSVQKTHAAAFSAQLLCNSLCLSRLFFKWDAAQITQRTFTLLQKNFFFKKQKNLEHLVHLLKKSTKKLPPHSLFTRVSWIQNTKNKVATFFQNVKILQKNSDQQRTHQAHLDAKKIYEYSQTQPGIKKLQSLANHSIQKRGAL